jgi:hypothetical protein
MKLVFTTLKGLANQLRWRTLLLAERPEGESTCKKQHLEEYGRPPPLSKQQGEKNFRNSSKGVLTIILRTECEDRNTGQKREAGEGEQFISVQKH